MRRTMVDDVDARVLPNLLAWYRAETVVGKFGDGQSALYALDESGHGNNLGGGGTVPLMNYAVCNGYAAYKFTGAMDLRNANVTFTSSVAGAFAVVKHTVAGNFAAGGGGGEGIITDYGSTNGSLRGDASVSNIFDNTATYTAYVNGVATKVIANTNAWNLLYIEFTSGKQSYTGTMMGRHGTGATFLTGSIVECGYFGNLPTSGQRTAFFNAMIAKYNITGVP